MTETGVHQNLPCRQAGDGVEIFVRATANASKNKIDGLYVHVNDHVYLKVYITSPAEDGKANDAICVVLSKHFGVPKSLVVLKSGHTMRLKSFVLQNLSMIDAVCAFKKILPPVQKNLF